jgi:hypothetical protein
MHMDTHPSILKLLPGERAIVSTKGRARVIDGSGYVYAELWPRKDCRGLVEYINELEKKCGTLNKKTRARIVGY